MRYPTAETAQKYPRILDEASRLSRERGFSGVNVGEIMQATGLTHGPFYNQLQVLRVRPDKQHPRTGEMNISEFVSGNVVGVPNPLRQRSAWTGLSAHYAEQALCLGVVACG